MTSYEPKFQVQAPVRLILKKKYLITGSHKKFVVTKHQAKCCI